MFNKDYKSNKDVEIKSSTGILEKATIKISMSDKSVFIYINNKLGNRIYWIGRKSGISAKLKLKFSDRTNSIKINSYKITFKEKQYLEIKANVVKYKLIDENNEIIFDYR
jgi:hypothetical protein